MSYNVDNIGQFIPFNENTNNIDHPQLEITYSPLDGDIHLVSRSIDTSIKQICIGNKNTNHSQRIKDLFESLINSLNLKDDNPLDTFLNHVELKQLLLPNSITYIDAIKINSLLQDWLKSNVLLFTYDDLKIFKNFLNCLKLITNYSIDLNNSIFNENETSEVNFIDTLKSEIIRIEPNLIKMSEILNNKLAAILLDVTLENITSFFSIYIDIKTLELTIEDLNDDDLSLMFHSNLNLNFSTPNYKDYYNIFLKFSSCLQDFKCNEMLKNFAIPSCFSYSNFLLIDFIIMLITDSKILTLLILDRHINKKLEYFNKLLDDMHCKETISKKWVINRLKNSLVDLCLGNEFEITKICNNNNSSLNKLLIFFNITNFGMDETNVKYFWDGILQIIKQNDKESLKKNFRLFISYLTDHQKGLFINKVFHKFMKFLHNFISFPGEIEFIENILFHINELQDIFDQTQFGYLKAYVTLVSNMIQNPQVSSIVEVMDINMNYLEDHKYPDFKLSPDCKLVYPKIIAKNLGLICTRLNNERKRVKINSNFQSVILNYTSGPQTYEIRCDSFCAVILLSFENVDKMKFTELQTKTKLKAIILNKKLNKLVDYGLITRDNDTIILVVEFSSPSTNITIL